MVFNTTFNNTSVISWLSALIGGRNQDSRRKRVNQTVEMVDVTSEGNRPRVSSFDLAFLLFHSLIQIKLIFKDILHILLECMSIQISMYENKINGCCNDWYQYHEILRVNARENY